MGVFLTAKQIVDQFYQFKLLDVFMVVFALGLMGYRFIKDKLYLGIKDRLVILDFSMAGLMVLFMVSLLRDMSALNEAIKIESAFLIYFLGRIYADQILVHGRKLAIAGYILIYVNEIYYYYQYINHIMHEAYPYPTLSEVRNGGALYYYKTDLAVAVLIATLFIYCFSKVKWLKYLTIYCLNPVFLFMTNARTGQIIYMALIIFVGVRDLVAFLKAKSDKPDKAPMPLEKKKKLVTIAFIVLGVLMVAFFIILQFTAVRDFAFDDLELKKKKKRLLEKLFHSRHIIIWDTLHYLTNQPLLNKLFGFDLSPVSFASHNSIGKMSHSLYLTALYGIGYMGVSLFVFVIYQIVLLFQKINDKTMKFLLITMWFCFLVYGLSVETLEFTQISWFPFLFAGAVATMSQGENNGK